MSCHNCGCNDSHVSLPASYQLGTSACPGGERCEDYIASECVLYNGDDLVDFPLEKLDLSPYVIGYKKNSYVYDLYGVCNHSGSVLGGHYTCFVKNANGKWYHFNDTLVSEVSADVVSIVSPKAYVLFYRKRRVN